MTDKKKQVSKVQAAIDKREDARKKPTKAKTTT